ncbi:MAG: hypothetical protein J6Y37_03680 [Paludibacteraceae bacterium]|nr:hypothetical protein [Paludibacteraceae bacterium]
MKNESKQLHIDSTLPCGKYKGRTVGDVLSIDRHVIFELIEQFSLNFDDQVLSEAHITKKITNVVFDNRVGCEEEQQPKKQQPLKKDTVSVRHIIRELSTVNKENEAATQDIEDDTIDKLESE